VVRETVADLGEVLWAARPPGELLETVRQMERLRSALDAVQLKVVAEIAATDAVRAEGWGSTKDFLTATTGGRKGAGTATVSLAAAVSTDRVAVGQALAAGRISRAQAQVIVGAVDRLPVNPGLRSAAEALLIEEARTRDASELETAGKHVLERLDPDGTERRDERAAEREARSAHAGRHLSFVEDGLGGVRLRGRGTVEDAAWIKTSLFPLAAPQPPAECGAKSTDRTGACGSSTCDHDGRDPRDHGARVWDALVEACRLLAGTDVLPTSHGATPRIAVTVDFEQLRDQVHRHPGLGLLDLGCSLSQGSVRRLACDADILPMVLGSRSQILDVGRLHRLVPLALWLVLVARDRHCAFPGCTRPPVACDAHHIRHWADGGVTSLSNLVLLCRRHHTIIHSTPWEVRLDPDDQRPEFLPPASLDPERRPLRRRPLRE
jgi:hypothetical protein